MIPGCVNGLIVHHRWIAEQCARRFRNRGESDHDLEQVAYIGLTKATDRYDPERRQKILLWRFFEECTQREIGERLGIGQVQVSRLLRSALNELRAVP